jgi:hypothetical protein
MMLTVSKSLVAAEAREASMRFRLLDTTRAYALEKLGQTGDRERLFRRHAEYYLDLFNRAEAEYQTRPTAEWLFDYARRLTICVPRSTGRFRQQAMHCSALHSQLPRFHCGCTCRYWTNVATVSSRHSRPK